MSRDHATAVQPGQQSEILSQKIKKKERGEREREREKEEGRKRGKKEPILNPLTGCFIMKSVFKITFIEISFMYNENAPIK